MPKRELIWRREGGGPCGARYLCYRLSEFDHGTGEPTDTATLDELADACDREAESLDYHTFRGVHAVLAKMLEWHVGAEKATAVLREIAEQGGLMSCG